MLLALLLTPVAGATPSVPSPQVEIVDEACEVVDVIPEGAPLRITYQRQATACSPGGPCERILDEPLSARALELWSETCGPAPGRFVVTGASCQGHRVWSWRRALSGGRYRVLSYPDVLATVAVGGEEAPCRDWRVEGPSCRVREEQETTRLYVSPSVFEVTARGDGGWLVTLDLEAAGLGMLSEHGARPEVIVEGPARPEHVLAGLVTNDRGDVELRLHRESWVEQREVEAGRHRECEQSQHHSYSLVLSGAELRFSGAVARPPRLLPRACEVEP